jgi:SOS-response transcriptional repressor LexA
MEKLKGIDRKILRYLEREWVENGHRPTYDEIRAALKLKAKNFVIRHIVFLEKLGYVRRKSKSCNIILLRTLDGHRITAGGYRIPIHGWITAGAPIPLLDTTLRPEDTFTTKDTKRKLCVSWYPWWSFSFGRW